MITSSRFSLALALLLACIPGPVHAAVETHFCQIGNEIVKTYNLVAEEQKRALANQQEPDPKKQALLTSFGKLATAFGILHRREAVLETPRETVISGDVRKSMELICGNSSAPMNNLLEFFRRNSSTAGYAVLAEWLTMPTNSLPKIMARQQVIKTLTNDDAFFDIYRSLVERAAGYEDTLYNIFQRADHETKDLVIGLPLLNKLNDNQVAVAAWHHWGMVAPLSSALSLPFFLYQLYSQRKETDGQMRLIANLSHRGNTPHDFKTTFGATFGLGMPALYRLQWKEAAEAYSIASKSPNVHQGGLKLGVAAAAAYLSWGIASWMNTTNVLYKRFATNKDRVNALQTALREVTEFINLIKQLRTLCQERPEFKDAFSSFSELEKIFDKQEELSAKLQEVLTDLATDTFKGESSYFSHSGRILVTWRTLLEIRDELAPLVYALGEFDAYLSAAKLVREFADRRVHYCFVAFRSSDKPYLKITNLWNPFVDHELVVTNSFELGEASSRTARNAIFTGANRGGKSTIMKAIVLDAILAQTLGIAAADEMEMTLFTKINAYMNIYDDTAAGISLFEAEARRARGLTTIIENLQPHEFALSILDEAFCGTAPEEGAAASYGLAYYLGTFKNSLSLLATHFSKEVSPLEQDTAGAFVNYQVLFEIGADGKIHYPYALKRGVTNQNVALKILEEHDFNKMVLDKAQEQIKRTRAVAAAA